MSRQPGVRGVMRSANERAMLVSRACALVLLAVVAGARPAAAQTTALFLDSQPGDVMGGGVTRTVTASSATFQISPFGTNGVSVTVTGPGNFRSNMTFAGPQGAPLEAGNYDNAASPTWPNGNGLDVSVSFLGCNSTGRFVVLELVRVGTTIVSFAADFESHCGNADPGIFGAVRYNSTISSLVPFDGGYPTYRFEVEPTVHGRVTGEGIDCSGPGSACVLPLASPTTLALTAIPDPGYLFGGWTAPCHGSLDTVIRVNSIKRCSALFIPIERPVGRLAWINAQAGEALSGGTREVFNEINSSWSVQKGTNFISLTVNGMVEADTLRWRFNLSAPSGQVLAPGTYVTTGVPGSGVPSVSLSYDSIGCSGIGTVIVHELTTTGTTVNSLALDFEQSCGVTIPPKPMIGSIRINSALPPLASLALVLGDGGAVGFGGAAPPCAITCTRTFDAGIVVATEPDAAAGAEFAAWTGDSACGTAVMMTAPVFCQATFRAADGTPGPVIPGTPPGGTALFLHSQPGDLIGFGVHRTMTPANSTFSLAFADVDEAAVTVTGSSLSTFSFLQFKGFDGVQITSGAYYAATRVSSLTPFAGIDVSVDGHGCNAKTGRFLVREIVRAGGTIQRLAVDFEQHCEDNGPALFGALRYNSTVTSLLPFDGMYPLYRLEIEPTVNGVVSGGGIDCQGAGPVCAITLDAPGPVTLTATPAPGYEFGGWSGACHGGLTIVTNVNTVEPCTARFLPLGTSDARFVFVNSQKSETILKGIRDVYNNANSVWRQATTTTSAGVITGVNLQISTNGDKSDSTLTYAFRSPAGQPFAPGTYRFETAPSGSIVGVSGNGTGCTATGPFTVHEFAANGSQVTKLAIDFEQICGTFSPPRPLHGSIRLNSSIPPTPAIAVVVGPGGRVEFGSPATSCLINCTATVPLGSPLAMRAIAAAGFFFTGWKGDAVCSDPNAVVTGPIGCEATFQASTISAVSVAPNAGSGSVQTFTLRYSSSAGASDLASVWAWFNGSFASSSANSCLVSYDSALHQYRLVDDSGQAWMARSNGILENSQCALLLDTSGTTPDGNTLQLSLNVRFKSAFVGSKKVFIYAASKGGSNSGWVEAGQWIVPAPSVTADSVVPASGTGVTQTFMFDYSSTFGSADVSSAWVWFNATFAASAAHSCLIRYEPGQYNNLLLLDDAGAVWEGGHAGDSGKLQNSQCSVSLAANSSSPTGTTRRLELTVTFSGAFAGTKNIYMFSSSSSGMSSGWQDRGDWTIPDPPPATVTAGGVLPASGSGATQRFSLHYASTGGAADLGSVWVWFNAAFGSSSAASCLAYYEPATRTLRLINDSGTDWQRATLGTIGTLQNGQCAIDVGTLSVSAVANDLTLDITVRFKPSFAGAKNIYVYAARVVGGNTGWQDSGDWTVPSGAVTDVTADGVSPSVASASKGVSTDNTFSFTYSSARGVQDLTSVWLWVNGSFAASAAHSCLAYYEPSSTRLFLLDDAGATWQSVPLVPGQSIQNGQCRIQVPLNPVLVNGNALTLTLQFVFASAFKGTMNIYLYASGASGNSGWQDLGDVIIPASVDAVSVTPALGSSSSQRFEMTYSHVYGSGNLRTAWVWFNEQFTASAANSCLAYYDALNGKILLLNDAGTSWMSALPVTGAILQNSQCSITFSSAGPAPGDMFRLILDVAFEPTFAGFKNIYLYAADSAGDSGWHDLGDWTVP